MRKGFRERLGESDDVHRDRDRLGGKEDDADRAAEFDAQAAADQVVGAAAFDSRVGRDRRERKRRERGDRLGRQNDQQRVDDSRLADHLAEPQEHDDAQDRQRAGREDAAERSELGGWRRLFFSRLCGQW